MPGCQRSMQQRQTRRWSRLQQKRASWLEWIRQLRAIPLLSLPPADAG
jgi:hypothetical protein